MIYPTKSKQRPGEQFGRLTVLGEPFRMKIGEARGYAFVTCQCECGSVCVIRVAQLRQAITSSCGCFHSERVSARHRTHGMTKTRLWRIHRGMIRRCYDPRSHNWAHYGGRGITLCQKWLGSFQAFHDWAMANGYRDDLTIDRIDNDGPYSPENCRWATAYEQENNRGNNHRLQLHNETKTVAEWGRDKRCRVRPSTLYGRLWRGWQPTPAILLQ